MKRGLLRGMACCLGLIAGMRPVEPAAAVRVTKAEMGTARTDTYEIVNPMTTFPSDTPKLVCVWKAEGGGLGTPLRGVWIAEDVGNAAPPNYKIDEKTLNLPFANEGSFSVTKPDKGWPPGKYRLEIYLGKDLARTVPFTIVPAGVRAASALAPPPPAQGGNSRAGAPATPSAGKPEKYEARWDLQNSGAADQLNSVYFIDVNTGWAAGKNNTVLKTTDGGKTWSRTLEREEGGNEFSSIFFTNAREGWAQGHTLLHSSDGGETWRPASPLPDRKNLGDGGAVGAIRLQLGQFGTSDRICKSEDGGTTWTPISTLPRNDFTAIFVLDPRHIWVAGDYGRYAFTMDGGATWQEPTMPVKARLNKVYFVSARIGWILPSDHNGGPLASTDGGLTWASQYAGAGQNRPLRDIHFVNERDGFLLVGSNRTDVVYRTADGGARWATIGQLPEGRRAMSFPRVDEGWVVGPNGYVVHYHLVPVPAAGK